MSAHETTHHDHHAHAHHGPANPPRTFTITLLALVLLTFITVAASYVNFGSDAVNVVIALTIATIKASLVAMIFMHLRWDKPVNGLIAVGGFLFLGIFLMFCVIDFDSRMDPPPPVLNATTPVPAPSTAPPPAAPQH